MQWEIRRQVSGIRRQLYGRQHLFVNQSVTSNQIVFHNPTM